MTEVLGRDQWWISEWMRLWVKTDSGKKSNHCEVVGWAPAGLRMRCATATARVECHCDCASTWGGTLRRHMIWKRTVEKSQYEVVGWAPAGLRRCATATSATAPLQQAVTNRLCGKWESPWEPSLLMPNPSRLQTACSTTWTILWVF